MEKTKPLPATNTRKKYNKQNYTTQRSPLQRVGRAFEQVRRYAVAPVTSYDKEHRFGTSEQLKERFTRPEGEHWTKRGAMHALHGVGTYLSVAPKLYSKFVFEPVSKGVQLALSSQRRNNSEQLKMTNWKNYKERVKNFFNEKNTYTQRIESLIGDQDPKEFMSQSKKDKEDYFKSNFTNKDGKDLSDKEVTEMISRLQTNIKNRMSTEAFLKDLEFKLGHIEGNKNSNLSFEEKINSLDRQREARKNFFRSQGKDKDQNTGVQPPKITLTKKNNGNRNSLSVVSNSSTKNVKKRLSTNNKSGVYVDPSTLYDPKTSGDYVDPSTLIPGEESQYAKLNNLIARSVGTQ